jgi:hypothetical protein
MNKNLLGACWQSRGGGDVRRGRRYQLSYECGYAALVIVNLQAQMVEGYVQEKQRGAKHFVGYRDKATKSSDKDKDSLGYNGAGTMRYY